MQQACRWWRRGSLSLLAGAAGARLVLLRGRPGLAWRLVPEALPGLQLLLFAGLASACVPWWACWLGVACWRHAQVVLLLLLLALPLLLPLLVLLLPLLLLSYVRRCRCRRRYR